MTWQNENWRHGINKHLCFSASVAQKSKYTRQRIVEPTTDLHQIYEATQNMESTLDTLICKYYS